MPAKDDFDLFAHVTEVLGLEGEEKENFITSAMKRKGHKPKLDWIDSDGDNENETGDFFSAKRRTRETERKPGNKGWQYGS